MKFMVDECVGPSLADWLRSQGYDVVSSFDDYSAFKKYVWQFYSCNWKFHSHYTPASLKENYYDNNY